MIAFVYPKETLPALLSGLQRWPSGNSGWHERIREWLKVNAAFQRPVQSLARSLGAKDIVWP